MKERHNESDVATWHENDIRATRCGGVGKKTKTKTKLKLSYKKKK